MACSGLGALALRAPSAVGLRVGQLGLGLQQIRALAAMAAS
jgi:hypothetical protein